MPEKIERTPVDVPLACFGLEYVATDATCASCPHRVECHQCLGTRSDRIPLARAEFQLLPPGFKLPASAADAVFDDPEIPEIERVYKDCFISVFERVPPSGDRLGRVAPQLVEAARKANCTLRLYFLANMVGHRAQQQRLLKTNDRAQPTRFSNKMLLGTVAEKRVQTYATVCRKDYGTFSPASLSVAAKHDVEKNALSQRMLSSEVAAGYFIVDWKISCGGPVEEALYRERELTLDPVWLATEPTYALTVIAPYLQRRSGSTLIQSHRFSVVQTTTEFKKNRGLAILAFKTRESIMPKATSEVLRLVGHASLDFEIMDQPVTSTVEYWRLLGLAIQHYNCLRYYRGEPSMLNL